VSWPALLARLWVSHPSLAWAGPIAQLWTFGTCWNKLCRSVILFSEQRTLPELLHLMWALLPVNPLASGFTNHVFLILARFSPFSVPALISRLLDSHPRTYLGPMGLSLSCRLLGLVGKNVCVFCFLCCALYPNTSTPCRPLF